MIKLKKGKLLLPATRTELVCEIARLQGAIKELITYLKASDRDALAGVMEIVQSRERDWREGDEV